MWFHYWLLYPPKVLPIWFRFRYRNSTKLVVSVVHYLIVLMWHCDDSFTIHQPNEVCTWWHLPTHQHPILASFCRLIKHFWVDIWDLSGKPAMLGNTGNKTEKPLNTLQMFCLLNSQTNAFEQNPKTTSSDFNSWKSVTKIFCFHAISTDICLLF